MPQHETAHSPAHDESANLTPPPTILEAAQAVVDGAVGTPDGLLVPLRLLDQLAVAVDRADTDAS